MEPNASGGEDIGFAFFACGAYPAGQLSAYGLHIGPSALSNSKSENLGIFLLCKKISRFGDFIHGRGSRNKVAAGLFVCECVSV